MVATVVPFPAPSPDLSVVALLQADLMDLMRDGSNLEAC